MNNKSNLDKARAVKNDEFYSRMQDIEKECDHYKQFFRNKIIYCCCDNPEKSNFYKYFHDNFHAFGLKRLWCTFLGSDEKYDYDGDVLHHSYIGGNGDMFSNACQEVMNEADLIITNPPFSRASEFLEKLIEKRKLFLIMNHVTESTKIIGIKCIVNELMWRGYTRPKAFITDTGEEKHLGNVTWNTNLPVLGKDYKLHNCVKYDPSIHNKYDDSDVIFVKSISEIPDDYDGIIGVPESFLDNYGPSDINGGGYYSQFKVVGYVEDKAPNIKVYNLAMAQINKKRVWVRVAIKKR